MFVICFVSPAAAAEYKDSGLGFSIIYPDSWQVKNSPAGTLLASPVATIPWVVVSTAEGDTFADALKLSIVLWKYSKVEASPEKEIITDNDVKAFTTKITFVEPTGHQSGGVVLGTQKGNRWIMINVSTVGRSTYDEAAF
jgi:hypothetical protein